MNQRNIFLKVMIWLLLAWFVGACSPAPGGPPANPSPAVHQTVLVSTPSILPSPAPPTPTPTPPPLGPVPQDCPPGSLLHPPLNGFGPVLGGGKVWFDGIGGPHAVIQFTGIDDYTSPYGHTRKLVWEVGPPPVGLVRIRGENLRTHQPLWFQFDDTPTTDAVLDPQHPNHPVSVVDISWAEWGSYLFIPAAGCYTLSASWPGGQWRIFFAAGRF